MIERIIQDDIQQHLFQGKVMVILGPRQTGKTTLLKTIAKQQENIPIRWLNCDEKETQQLLENASLTMLRVEIGNNKMLFIDEAQKVNNIGLTLKLIADNMPEVQVIVTGSSALDLRNRLQEPLTGRKREYKLLPISTAELVRHSGIIEEQKALEMRLIYGSYPAIINNPTEAKDTLVELADSYLYKDILALENIRKPALLDKLLVALAFQIGSEVSFNELANTIGTDNKTVERYVDLLEKCFVVFRLPAFSRNIRTELKKSRKIFFYDNGIRNAILQNFAPLSLREDKGKLWENFVIAERMKRNVYTRDLAHTYFWRTTDQQEIDYIEEIDGAFHVFEMKSKANKTASIPALFKASYKVDDFSVVTPDNYLEFLMM